VTTEDKAPSLRQLATSLAAELSAECRNQQEAQEAVRLLQEQIEWIYAGKPLQP
jgi:hypothetical protein